MRGHIKRRIDNPDSFRSYALTEDGCNLVFISLLYHDLLAALNAEVKGGKRSSYVKGNVMFTGKHLSLIHI